MRRITLALATVLALPIAEELEGQQRWSIELGTVGRYTVYDEDIGINNAIGGGGRIGLFVLDNLAIEAEATYGEPGLTGPSYQGRDYISHLLYRGNLVYTHWVSDNAGFLFGAGIANDAYSRARNVAPRGWGGGGFLGLRLRFTDYLSWRIEGTGQFVSEDPDTHVAPRPSTFNLGLQTGLSLVIGEREVERIVELPPPPPDTVVITREVAPPMPQGMPSEVCIATGENVTIYLTPQGDTLVGPNRVALNSLGSGVGFAGEYASGRGWFQADEPIDFEEREYVQSGGEVGLDCGSIMHVGAYDGVPLFAEVGASSPFETVYVPVRPGVWQAYQTDLAAVRAE